LVTGTLLVLLAAREAGVKRVVYATSAGVYGQSSQPPRRESDPLCPHSLYAAAKVMGELYCETFSQVYQLETVRLRYGHVYGPRQAHEGPSAAIIPRLLLALLSRRNPVIYGDGLQPHDFIYVEDVVQGNLLAAQATRACGKVYNLGCGRQTTLLEVVGHLNELLGTCLPPVHEKPRLGDIGCDVADNTLAQAELGFCHYMDLKKGLQHCIDYYGGRQSNPDKPAAAG
jgi:UDP-glucose 4-epimerase